jgi:hypothetical protein
MEHDALNWERSGGQFNVLRRRLQHFTIKANPNNGRFLVIDDSNGQTVGNYATPEAAIKAFQPYDYRRTWGAA